MNIKVFGIVNLKERVLPTEELCFFIVEKSIKNKIGIRIGCNISPIFEKKIENFIGIIPFELTNNPLEGNAEFLFSTKEASVANANESFSFRMMRVQKFLNGVLQNKFIKNIVLEVNAENIDKDNTKTIKVDVHNFYKKMIQLYEHEDNCKPPIRIIVNKE